MRYSIKDYLSDRLTGGLVLALILFAALAISGGPGEPSISTDAVASPTHQSGSGPYHTLDAL